MKNEPPTSYVLRGTDQYGNPVEEVVVSDDSTRRFVEGIAFLLAGRRKQPPEGSREHENSAPPIVIAPKDSLG